MKLNKKIAIIVISMIIILAITPLIFIKLAQPHEFMGIMILLFFVVNPITSIFVNSMVGRDIKKLWWTPIMFCIIFLLSYWFILKEIILDLMVYAVIYIIIGIIFMIGSWYFTNIIKK